MANEYVLYEKKDRIAYITINRPEVLNALHAGANAEMYEVFCDFRDDDHLWVAIVTGAGDRAFSAGNDLKVTAARSSGNAPPAPANPAPFGGITRGFHCSKPIIAAVNGYAVGGGFEIALSCDIIIASENARFGLPEPRVGLVAAASGVHRLPQQVGLKQAMGLILTGRIISAAEAFRIGVVNEVVPHGELMAAAQRWADEILECAPLSVQISKESAMSGLYLSIDDALQEDQDLGRGQRLRESTDYIEGPRAFAEKRRPNWVGR